MEVKHVGWLLMVAWRPLATEVCWNVEALKHRKQGQSNGTRTAAKNTHPEANNSTCSVTEKLFIVWSWFELWIELEAE